MDSDAPQGWSSRTIGNNHHSWAPAWLPLRIDRGYPAYRQSESPPFWSGWQVTIRYWTLTIAAAMASLGFARIKWRARMLYAKARCNTCGYDLRAKPDRGP